MKGPMPVWMFRFMEFMLALRDLLISPRRRLVAAGVREGSRVLDFGCGPGTYSIGAARMAGPEGRVYALDIHPFAADRVAAAAAREKLGTITTIVSDCATGLDDGSVDIILFYDTIHLIGDPAPVIREMHRVLSPGGTLSVFSHFMRGRRIVEIVTREGRFEYRGEGYESLLFVRGPG
ncbi:MAG: class I SAM-dependent methyltransferase [Spirochaetes bacterium]|nr:class I SAM-dependent methyltransferase [Spirochaetota bacterium]